VGVLLDSEVGPGTARSRVGAYLAAGGAGARVIVRRVWVGDRPDELYERQLAHYRRHAAAGGSRQPSLPSGQQAIIAGAGRAVAGRLIDVLRTTGARSLVLQVHLPGVTAAAARRQIERAGTELLPELRRHSEW
jgi:hypothetical protein